MLQTHVLNTISAAVPNWRRLAKDFCRTETPLEVRDIHTLEDHNYVEEIAAANGLKVRHGDASVVVELQPPQAG